METKDFVWSWKPGETWYSGGLLGTEQEARVYFWNNSQETLLKAIRKEINDGWKPITEIGPSSFKLRSYTKQTFGAWIAGVPPRVFYEPVEFRVALMKDS